MLAAGARNTLITVQTATTGQDPDSGEETLSWATHVTAWVKWVARAVGEAVIDQHEQASVRYQATGLFADLNTVTPKMRITLGGNTYSIVGVRDPTGLRKEIVIDAVLVT